jgi:sulfatase maturation enzyme AslB (radical SAM superfamily)
MTYPFNVTSIHLELTDKCQAACPMCPRNWFGGRERDYVRNEEITLQQFQQWFPGEFLQQIKHIYACGNLGDPLLAKDCLEIFQYIADNTQDDCTMSIHTNGSLRNEAWWKELAKVLGTRGQVTFGIDGLSDTHEIYRRNTSFEKIIKNAKTFIDAGGRARADTIVFKHNEHQVEQIEVFLKDIGFESINFKATQRFYGMDNFPVKDNDNNTLYYIFSPIGKRWTERMIDVKFDRIIKPENYNRLINESIIQPDCKSKKEIFVNAYGEVFPCCQVGGTYTNVEDVIEADGAEYEIRKRMIQSTKEFVKDVTVLNLHGTNIVEVLKNCGWDEAISKNTTVDKKLICVKNCAVNIRDLVEENPKHIPVKLI